MEFTINEAHKYIISDRKVVKEFTVDFELCRNRKRKFQIVRHFFYYEERIYPGQSRTVGSLRSGVCGICPCICLLVNV